MNFSERIISEIKMGNPLAIELAGELIDEVVVLSLSEAVIEKLGTVVKVSKNRDEYGTPSVDNTSEVATIREAVRADAAAADAAERDEYESNVREFDCVSYAENHDAPY